MIFLSQFVQKTFKSAKKERFSEGHKVKDVRVMQLSWNHNEEKRLIKCLKISVTFTFV